MPIDTSIPLSVRPVDISQGIAGLTNAFQMREQMKDREQQRELVKVQLANEKIKALDAREQRRLQGSILGAAQLDPYLANNDVEGATAFLTARRQNLLEQAQAGGVVDTNETDQALRMLQSGDVAGLRKITQGAIQLGRGMGILKAPEKASWMDAGGNQVQLDASGNPTGVTMPKTAPPKAPDVSPLGKLIEEMNGLPPGDPRKSTYEQAINKQSTHAPAVSIQNTNGPLAPAKTTQSKLDEALLTAGDRKSRLMQIETSFKPEFLTFESRLGSAWSALKEKGGMKLSGGDKASLEEFSRFKSDALNNLNLYIKEITGAAMSEREADRIRTAMPDPGSGLFDGDSPTQFKSKLDQSVQQVKMAEARAVYVKRNGLSMFDGSGNPTVSLDRMPEIIRERGNAIEADIKARNKSMDQKRLQRLVIRQLGNEFGIATD